MTILFFMDGSGRTVETNPCLGCGTPSAWIEWPGEPGQYFCEFEITDPDKWVAWQHSPGACRGKRRRGYA